MTAVVMAADEHYLPYVRCSFAQLSRFGRRAEGVTLVVPAGVDSELLADVHATASVHGVQLDVVPVSELDVLSARQVITDYRHVTHHTYCKVLLAEVLPHLDEVLYLDVDTLIRVPLDDLLAWRLTNPLGAVAELGDAGVHLFGTPRPPYFNAGVLRMSLRRFREEQVWDRAQQLFGHHEITLQDQDVLNQIFMNRFDSLPQTFNVFDDLAHNHKELAILRDPAIVHFCGATKPWHPAARTPFAREWRRWYAQATFSPAARGYGPVEYGEKRSAEPGRPILAGLARRTLPASARRAAKSAASDLVDRALVRLDDIRSTLSRPPAPSHMPSWGTLSELTEAPPDEDHHLDLMISVPGSGTNALGEAIRHSRPDVNWISELYSGAPRDLNDGELAARFPWFAAGDPEVRQSLSPGERARATGDFVAKMNEHVVELTQAVIETRTGRALIKVFPGQLHPSALGKLLAAFRPRLLILRRDLVFTYISSLRATQANSWRESDLPEVPPVVRDQDALNYAMRSDSWINGVAGLARSLRLQTTWLTYAGLFSTGDDVRQLAAFYPGAPIPVDVRSGSLQSSMAIQDHRTDASVLAMVRAVSSLSATAQTNLLRLPGNPATAT